MRSVFYISDQTGITTNKLGSALLSKFPEIDFRNESFPFANTPLKISQALLKVRNRFFVEGTKPIIIASVLDPELRIVSDLVQAINAVRDRRPSSLPMRNPPKEQHSIRTRRRTLFMSMGFWERSD